MACPILKAFKKKKKGLDLVLSVKHSKIGLIFPISPTVGVVILG